MVSTVKSTGRGDTPQWLPRKDLKLVVLPVRTPWMFKPPLSASRFRQLPAVVEVELVSVGERVKPPVIPDRSSLLMVRFDKASSISLAVSSFPWVLITFLYI